MDGAAKAAGDPPQINSRTERLGEPAAVLWSRQIMPLGEPPGSVVPDPKPFL